VKLHDRPDLDPAVLAKLRKIAAIRENPYASLQAMQAKYAFLQGELDVPPPATAADQFDLKIRAAIDVAHFCIALSHPKKLTARKEIARCAQELANVLQALRRQEKDLLVLFLPHCRQATFDDFVAATRELADEARHICSLAGRPLGRVRRITRRAFVNCLLSAAGGKLTLNARTERGTLVDAVELLLPYLPQEISKMPSFSTLKSLRRAWGKKRKKEF